jgi:hypothetical protein
VKHHKVLVVRDNRLEETLDRWSAQGWRLLHLCHSGRDGDGFDRYTLIWMSTLDAGAPSETLEDMRQ